MINYLDINAIKVYLAKLDFPSILFIEILLNEEDYDNIWTPQVGVVNESLK